MKLNVVAGLDSPRVSGVGMWNEVEGNAVLSTVTRQLDCSHAEKTNRPSLAAFTDVSL